MKIVRLLILLLLMANITFAQQIPFDNYYLISRYSLSPALCGATGDTEALLGVRQNWVGINGAPEKQSILLDGPLDDRATAGYGLSFSHEKTGNLTHFYGSLAYARHINVTRESHVSIGLAGEVYRNQLEFADVKGLQDDPVLQNLDVYKGTTFNAALGVAYRMRDRDKYAMIGVVVPRLLETKIDYKQDTKFTLARQFLVHASYFTELNRNVDIEPFVIARMTMNSGLLYEANIRFRFMKKVWVAPGYRNNTPILSVGAALGNRIVMNYSYEYGMNGIAASSSGSHEISLCFLVKPPFRRKAGPSIWPETRDDVAARKKQDEIKKLKKELKTQQDSTNKKIAELAAQLAEIKKNPPVQDVAQTQDKEEEKKEESWAKPFILKNIKFAHNSEKLFSSSFPSLNKLAANLKRNPSMMVKITGFTDNVGSSRYNQRLSQKRAQSVADYLTSRRGIKKDRILVDGKGEENPIATNDTEQGRAKNRRIEVRFKRN